MKTMKDEKLSMEIAVVGGRYGEMSQLMKPIFDQKENVESQDVKRLMSDDEIVLMPIGNNPYDPYAVAVMTMDRKRIGYVWMYQAPAISRWLKKGSRKYVKARICRICGTAGVMMVMPEEDIPMEDIERCDTLLDKDWASDLPRERISMTEYSLCLGMEMLYDELTKEAVWSSRLQQHIDSLLKALPMDLSAHHYKEGFEVYNLMMRSADARLRLQGEKLLCAFVHRGSAHQMGWWAENWLTGYFREVAASGMLRLFEAEGYTQERVEQLLEEAPDHLFTMYKADRLLFATRLYYASLPLKIYNRLLTLLAVWELMRGEQTQSVEMERVSMIDVPKEELNIFAPQKSLQTLLRGSWFSTCCTDNRYNGKWTDQFIADLMNTEWGTLIAKEWSVKGVRNKQKQIRAYVVGQLKDAGVLNGSYDAIAKKICRTVEPRVFSRYMGKGKKQPYADWVKTYPKYK